MKEDVMKGKLLINAAMKINFKDKVFNYGSVMADI